MWTDGLRGRSDGLLSADDLESDFTHPAANGHVLKSA
jgi:hypothetical protein